MVKRLIKAVALVALAIVAVALPAYAVDISGALYYADIVATNASTAADDVAAVCSINSQALLDESYVTPDFYNTAIQTSSGTDVPYMPGVGANPWCIYTGDFAASESKSWLFYAGGPAMQTGFPYFPAAGGMTSADAASLELGDNWAIEDHVWLSTTTGANKRLTYKDGAIESYIDGAGELTVDLSPSVTTTVYGSTSDGRVYRSNQFAAYADEWAAASADTAVSNATTIKIGQYYTSSTYQINRSAFYFDTSGLPDTAVVTGATLYLYGSADGSTIDFSITLQTGAPTYPHNPLVVGDYNKANYSSDGGSLSTSGFTAAGYNAIALNATGLTWVSLTGTTKFCIRSSRDISGTSSTSSEYVTVYAADEAGTTKDPYMSITYYDPGSVSLTATGITSGEHTVKVTGNAQLLSNASFETGDPPTGWSYSGAGATWVRSAAQVKVGSYSGVLTRNGANARAYQSLVPASYIGKTLTIGAWVYTSTPGAAFIGFNDGVTAIVSPAHSGTPGWEWMEATGPVSAGASQLLLIMYVYNGDATAYFDGASVIVGDTYPANLAIYVDDMDTPEAELFNYESTTDWSVRDNANNWSFATNSSVLYMYYHKIWVDDALVQHIVYERDTTFDDATASNNDATPTFRTTASDADVTCTLDNFRPVEEAECSAGLSEPTPEMIDSAPGAPDEFYGATGWGVDHLPGAALINDLLDSAGIPQDFFWIIVVFGAAAVIAHLAYWGLKSVLFPSVAGGIVILFFSLATGGDPIPLWTILIYIVIVFGINTSERTYGL